MLTRHPEIGFVCELTVQEDGGVGNEALDGSGRPFLVVPGLSTRLVDAKLHLRLGMWAQANL